MVSDARRCAVRDLKPCAGDDALDDLDSLWPADRAWFIAAAKVGAKAQRDRVNADEFASLTELKAQGMQINAYVDTQAFRKLLRPRYAQLMPNVDMNLADEIRNAR